MTPDLIELDPKYEWYPCRGEIIKDIQEYILKGPYLNVLDVGAGDGRVLDGLGVLRICRKYAIEIQPCFYPILKDKGYKLLDTDFVGFAWFASVLDAVWDVIVCNPPFTYAVEWIEKILMCKKFNRLIVLCPAVHRGHFVSDEWGMELYKTAPVDNFVEYQGIDLLIKEHNQ